MTPTTLDTSRQMSWSISWGTSWRKLRRKSSMRTSWLNTLTHFSKYSTRIRMANFNYQKWLNSYPWRRTSSTDHLSKEPHLESPKKTSNESFPFMIGYVMLRRFLFSWKGMKSLISHSISLFCHVYVFLPHPLLSSLSFCTFPFEYHSEKTNNLCLPLPHIPIVFVICFPRFPSG